ncbi:MAG: hypothetical protein RR051_07730, partial [Clostridiales bacterium]
MMFHSATKTLQRKGFALLLICSVLFMIASPAGAEPDSTPKEEVVYANLNADGSVDMIYVVNIFTLSAQGKIVDYGNYKALRNMTSAADIKFDQEKITIDAPKGKLYYEGTLAANSLPWQFTFHYYLDGQEYAAQDLAGQNGHLEITLAIRENPAVNSAFFDHYALQTNVSLDADLCREIQTTGATIANVGKYKQLTYTILPGQTTDITITA